MNVRGGGKNAGLHRQRRDAKSKTKGESGKKSISI